MTFLGCLTEPGALLCGSEGEELCSMLVYSQHYDCVTLWCVSTGSFRRGTGLSLVTCMFFRVVQCITAVLCKSLFEILYCVQRGNLDELFLIMIWVMSVVLLHLL